MIEPLNNLKLEKGFRAYLEARFQAGEIVAPAPAGDSTVTSSAPPVIAATAGTVAPTGRSYVAILVPETPADLPGLYGERLRVQIVVFTPFPYPPGIDADDHAALCAAVTAAFPARPRIGSATYEDDLETWSGLVAGLDEAVEDAAGYHVSSWYVEGSRTNRTAGSIEEVLTIRPCVYHPDHAGA